MGSNAWGYKESDTTERLTHTHKQHVNHDPIVHFYGHVFFCNRIEKWTSFCISSNEASRPYEANNPHSKGDHRGTKGGINIRVVTFSIYSICIPRTTNIIPEGNGEKFSPYSSSRARG